MTDHQQKIRQPELLMPAGDMETFRAAVAGSADAVYLGIKKFNARGRAHNFNWRQLAAVIEAGKKYEVKIYVTLNTVIKNTEIDELIDTLHALDQLRPDAIIIQDWGVYYLVRQFFPKLKLHASTQMGIHNSAGANHAAQAGFERVIMARELTLPEITDISKKSKTEIELFIHGALCYSFSGMCLYSSFIGGQGANRGLCKQPCRRIFHTPKQSVYPFSLKDLKAAELIPAYSKLGIHALKVEGRLKSAEYVYKVAQAYKEIIKQQQVTTVAQDLLEMDMGRDKTSYFAGGKVTDAITDRTATGFKLGKITDANGQNFSFESTIPIQKGDRIRILHRNGEQTAFKLHNFKQQNNKVTAPKEKAAKYSTGDQVFLASRKTKIENLPEINEKKANLKPTPSGLRKKVKASLGAQKTQKPGGKRNQIYVRINELNWIKKVQFQDIEGLFVQLPINQLEHFRTEVPFIKKNLHKVYIELPQFIPEKSLPDWEKTIKELKRKGIKKFIISHLSQRSLFHPNDYVGTNENVYCFNDAAIKALKQNKIQIFTYPLENDIENMQHYGQKNGILPVYFRPKLFISRMPVKLNVNEPFKDDDDITLEYARQANLNIIYPQNPVSFTHHINAFKKSGYNRFLIDYSFEKPSQNRWKTVLKRLYASGQLQPAFSFNMKKGLI